MTDRVDELERLASKIQGMISQEGCDGEPYDSMQKYIDSAKALLAKKDEEIADLNNQVTHILDEYNSKFMRPFIAEKDAEIEVIKDSHTWVEMQLMEKDKEIAALKAELAEFREIESTLDSQIKELEELQFAYNNTPFAHWVDRAKKAEAENLALKEKVQKMMDYEALRDAHIVSLTRQLEPIKELALDAHEGRKTHFEATVKIIDILFKENWLKDYAIKKAVGKED